MSFNVNKTFWSSLIIWDFWTWKTYGVENMVYEAKYSDYDWVYLISNIPNKITDLFYNSPDDLRQIIEWLFRFFQETNSDIEKYNHTFRDIILVIDEVHNYFPQDNTVLSSDKDLLAKLRVILTQCRKRNLKMYLCSQRWKTININVRRYTDYIYMYNMQNFFNNPKLRKNTLEIYKCWWWVSDLLWEDWVSWATIDDLEKDKIDTITMEYNTFLLENIYKLKHFDWELWKEKHLTQYICGLPWDYLNISSYDEFRNNLVFWDIDDIKPKIKTIYNQDWLPLLYDSLIYMFKNKDDREKLQFRY